MANEQIVLECVVSKLAGWSLCKKAVPELWVRNTFPKSCRILIYEMNVLTLKGVMKKQLWGNWWLLWNTE